jgi:hypothetical protein
MKQIIAKKNVCSLATVGLALLFCCLCSPAHAQTILFGNGATAGQDYVYEYSISGTTATLINTYAPPGGNGRGVVTVGNVIYTTISGPQGNIFGGDNHIYETDRTTGLPLGVITVASLAAGDSLSTLAWDGSQFWASEYLGGNHAYRIDLSGNITTTITLGNAVGGQDGMEYFNGKLIANRGDAVGPYDIYSLSGGAPTTAAFINSTSSTTGIAFDGTNFFTSNIFAGTLSEWDGTTGAFIQTITLSNAGSNPLLEDLSVDYSIRSDTGNVPDTGSTLLLLGIACAVTFGVKRRLVMA